MAEEETAAGATSPVSSDLKRKHDDLEPLDPKTEEVSSPPIVDTTPVSNAENTNENAETNPNTEEIQDSTGKEQEIDNEFENHEAKRPRLEEEAHDISAADPDLQMQKEEPAVEENVQQPSTENNHEAENDLLLPVENVQQPPTEVPQQTDLPPVEQPKLDPQPSSHKIEVPNTKVGVLIGKAGDTIRFLQYNSGAKIQITRDADADPHLSTRPVELIGTPENINKAEQLIKDVIAEADAGGSPSLVARGFGTAQTGGEQIQIQVPNEKVGLIIGKGGETIKNLQTRSGARIQLIPQHLPEGDVSKERTVRVTGNKKQIETAKEMIKEVMNQNPVRPSPLSAGYTQQSYRPRGPSGPPLWGPRAPPPAQPTNYDYQQRGMYPSQTTQYPPQTYSGYPQQQAPRSNFNTGWEQRPPAPMQTPPQSGGYDYYGQGGHVGDAPGPTSHIPHPVPGPAHSHAPVPTHGHVPGPAPTQVNYNYGQPQGSDYGQPATYPQSAPPQQSYGHGYDEPKYENQAPIQQAYGGQAGNPQPGAYPQQVSSQAGYAQQSYGKPTYGMPAQGPPPQPYVPPRTSQPGDIPYQGPNPSTHSYGSSGPPQQSYPYASNASSQQTYPYGSAPAANDGYTQPSTAPAPSYAQQGGAAPAYGPQGGQTAPGYVGPSGGYAQYPPSQPVYGEQPPPSNPSYGYQGSADAGFSNLPGSAYGAPAGGQAGYAQPTSNQPGYEQPIPQSGYGSHAGTAPVGYAKSLSPQPAYAAQYETGHMYGHH